MGLFRRLGELEQLEVSWDMEIARDSQPWFGGSLITMAILDDMATMVDKQAIP